MFTRIFRERTPSLALIFTDNEDRAKCYIDSITPFLNATHEIHAPATQQEMKNITTNPIEQMGAWLKKMREQAFAQDRLYFIVVKYDDWGGWDFSRDQPTCKMLSAIYQADIALELRPDSIVIYKAKGHTIAPDGRSAHYHNSLTLIQTNEKQSQA